MAVAKRIRDGKVTWRARWRDDRGGQHSKSFARKVDAERFMTHLEHQRLNGAYVDPAAGKMTVGEWARRWMHSQVQLKPKTRSSYESLLRWWLLPRWDRVALNKVTFGGVAEWVGAMYLTGLSASRTRQAYHLMTGMLDDAVKDGRLIRNPAAGVDLPRMETKPRRYLRHPELHALADACGPYRVLVLTLGYCGLRWGEVAALRVHNDDLRRGRIEVTRAVAEINGRIVLGTPKSHQTRWLPVPKLLLEGLEQQVAGKSPDDLVFPSPQGGVPAGGQLPARLLRPDRGLGRAARLLPPRAAAHRGVRGDRVGSDRQERAADARARLRDADAGPLRAPVRGRARRRRRPPGRRDAGERCGPDVVPMWSRADLTLFDDDDQGA